MLYILLSWIYVFLCVSVSGVAVNRVFKLVNNVVVTQFLGFFAICLFASFFAIFSKIGLVFHGFLLFLILVCAFFNWADLKQYFRKFYGSIGGLKPFLKFCFLIISLLILAQCASPAFVLDNETYYLQTIKWLNEYGFVKGLANLHLFFGQTSGWHILQSVFNLSFLYDNFNDLSGYCLWLGNLFAFQKLQTAFNSEKNKTLLLIGILPFANVLFFRLISAPSPIVPVIVICFLIFYLLLKSYADLSKSDFISITFLCFFVLFIKVVSIFLVLVPLFLWWKNFREINAVVHKLVVVGFLTLSILIAKNLILTGYPLFPLNIFPLNSVDYIVPGEYIGLFYQNKYSAMSLWQQFVQWLQQPGLEGIFNKLIVGLLAVFPLFLKKKKDKKPLLFIYIIAVAQIAVLFLFAPQYRFFLVFILFFGNFIFVQFIHKKKTIRPLLAVSMVLSAIPLFFPVNFNSLTENERMVFPGSFKMEYFIEPHKNSKYDYTYKTVRVGNLNYRSPRQAAYFWVNGDGNLPCVNQVQIEFFKRKFEIVPQKRGTALGKGFYSHKIKRK